MAGRPALFSIDGAVISITAKVTVEMAKQIEEMAKTETKFNKSEMVRILLQEAIDNRIKTEEMLKDMENELNECSGEN